jgi:hypothetical protein
VDIWHAYLSSAALAAAVIVWPNRRAVGWICCGAAAFAISDEYSLLGLPRPEAFTFVVDTVQVLLIYARGRFSWEKPGLWRIWQASMLWSGARIGWPDVIGHTAYAIGLELFNYAALLLIAFYGHPAADREPRCRRRHSPRDRLLRSLMALRQEREDEPFHKTWRRQ